jgi:hypothetical protein
LEPVDGLAAFLSRHAEFGDEIRFSLAVLSLFGVGANRRSAFHELHDDLTGGWSALREQVAQPENSHGKLDGTLADDRRRHSGQRQQPPCRRQDDDFGAFAPPGLHRTVAAVAESAISSYNR